MMGNSQVLEIIQDHALVTEFITQLCCSIDDEESKFPNYVPACNDMVMTDRLTMIAEHIKKLRGMEP